MRRSRILFLLIFTLTLALPHTPALAQTPEPGGAYYTVQAGDSLWSIAALFGLTLDDLQQANQIGNADQLSPGMKLTIPGVTGYQGELAVQTAGFGETLASLSARYGIPAGTLAQMNRLTSPYQVYAGDALIMPAGDGGTLSGKPVPVAAGEPLLEAAILNGTSPWALASANGLAGASAALPGQAYLLPAADGTPPSALPADMGAVAVTPLPLVQGKTVEVRVKAPAGAQLSGALGSYPLNFFPFDGGYVALQGINNQLDPGLYPMTLKVTAPAGEVSFSQAVAVLAGKFITDPPLTVDPKTVDPAVTVPEDAQWAALGKPVTPDKLWDGQFQSPVPPELKDCWTSLFGNRRTYNGGAYSSYHGGLDFCGQVGTPLYAPAAGKVVFTGSQVVRGNVLVIDHGWGVYTAYAHLSQILVKVGDVVTPGQEIALGGATGRTTGPHLHFEVWAGGQQVDPVDWLERAYP
jgi:murein DD-endopeptidase MepM/ murein hydrolase activator NlpD